MRKYGTRPDVERYAIRYSATSQTYYCAAFTLRVCYSNTCMYDHELTNQSVASGGEIVYTVLHDQLLLCRILEDHETTASCKHGIPTIPQTKNTTLQSNNPPLCIYALLRT